MKNKTEEEILDAIEKYKKLHWLNPSCEKCFDRLAEIKEDTQTSTLMCEKCLEENLRDDLQGLFDTI